MCDHKIEWDMMSLFEAFFLIKPARAEFLRGEV